MFTLSASSPHSLCRCIAILLLANAFKTGGWPMFLIQAEGNAFNTSGAYNGGGPNGGFIIHKYGPPTRFKSMGHPLVLKVAGNYLF